MYEPDVPEWRKLNIWGLDPMVWMYASKRELWDNIEKLPSEVDLADDVWFTPQVVSKTKKIVSLGEALYYYDRTNACSIMHSYTGKRLCRGALALYRILKMNNGKSENMCPLSLQLARSLLVESYCVHCVKPDLNSFQIGLIKNALKDLKYQFPQKKMKKSYFIQFCVIYGIDFVCRWYGKSRIKRFKRQQNK